MTPVDTETLAVHLRTTPREVQRRARAGELRSIGRWRTGRRGRPSMWFDLDDLTGESDLTGPVGACVNSDQGGVLCHER